MIDTLPAPSDADWDRWATEHARGEQTPADEVVTELSVDPTTDAPDAFTVATLSLLDLPAASESQLLDAIVGWERVAAFATGMQARAVAEFAARRPPVEVEPVGQMRGEPPTIDLPAGLPAVSRYAGAEISLELHQGPRIGAWRIEEAMTLTHRLPQTLDRLCAGEVSIQHARALIGETRELDRDDAGRVESQVLAQTHPGTPAQLRRTTRRAAIAADPAAATARRERAVRGRHVELTPNDDGTAHLYAQLPAADAVAIVTRLDDVARATRAAGDARTLDQLRADALVEAILHGAGPAGRPLINITLPAGTALDISDLPAELAGYGPIDADYARAIAGSDLWRRILTDPATGIATDVGRTYRPPTRLRDLIRARCPDCPFPTCTAASTQSDFDHPHPHRTGGHTSADHTTTPCRQHHRTKHAPGWKVSKRPDHTIEWTTPTGRIHTQPAQHYHHDLPTDPPF